MAHATRVAETLDPATLENPEVRTRAAGEAASRVAVHPGVRSALFDLQRTFATRFPLMLKTGLKQANFKQQQLRDLVYYTYAGRPTTPENGGLTPFLGYNMQVSEGKYGPFPFVQLAETGNPGDPASWQPFNFAFHYFWGLEDVISVFLNMWNQIETNKQVGGLFPNDGDGNAWGDPNVGLKPALAQAGFDLLDPGRYQNLSDDFTAQVNAFKDGQCDIITGVVIPTADVVGSVIFGIFIIFVTSGFGSWRITRRDMLRTFEQEIIERQNVYDGTWEKTASMGWMFVPLTQLPATLMGLSFIIGLGVGCGQPCQLVSGAQRCGPRHQAAQAVAARGRVVEAGNPARQYLIDGIAGGAADLRRC